MKINKIWNPLTLNDDRQVHDVEEGLTPNEIIAAAGLSFVRPFYLLVNGEPLGRAEWDSYRVRETDICHFVELPGEAISAAIAAWVAKALSTYMAATTAATVGKIVGSIATTLLTMGGLTLINRFLTQAPNTPSGMGQQDQIYEISSGANRARLNSPYAEHFGKLKVYPDIATWPYVEYSNAVNISQFADTPGGYQYMYFLGIIGVGEYTVHNVYIDKTDVTNMTGVDYSIIEPGNTSVIPYHSAIVFTTDTFNGQLLNQKWDADFTPLQCVVNPPGSACSIGYIAFDLNFPAGIYYQSGTGDRNLSGVFIRAHARRIDDDGTPLGEWTSILWDNDAGPWESWQAELEGLFIGNASPRPIRITLKAGVPEEWGRYELRIGCVDVDLEEPKHINECYLGQIRGIGGYHTDSGVAADFSDCTLIAMKIRADSNITGAIADKINVVATRKLYPVTATGFGGTAVASRSIADAVAYMVTSDNGGKQADSLIDWSSLYDLREAWETNGWYFDYRFQSRMSVMEACALAARCGRAVPYMPGKFMLIMDEEQTTPSIKFTATDYTKDSFKLVHNLRTADSPTGVEIHCIDADTWSDAVVECYDSSGSDENLAVVSLDGCTSTQQAYDIGMYIYWDDLENRTDVEFACGLKGHIPLPGSRVLIDIPAADGFSHSGLIQDIDGTDIYLSEDIEWGSETTGVIYLTGSGGALAGPYTVTPGTSDHIVSGSLPEETRTAALYADAADRYLFAFSANEAVSMRVTSIQPIGQNDVRISGTIYGDLPYTSTGSVPSVSQGLLDSVSLSYGGWAEDSSGFHYTYTCGWTGSATKVKIELDEGSGYATKEDDYTSHTYDFTVDTALSITLKITPYDGEVLSTDDALTESYTVPPTVTGLALVGAMGEEWEISWDADSSVDSYVIYIYVDDVLTATMTETSAGRTFTLSDMIAINGPYDSWDVYVSAKIGSKVGKPDTLNLSYSGWAPTGLVAESREESIFLTATYVKTNSFEALEVWVSETNDRSAAYKAGETGGSTYLAVGLEGGATYYFWVKVRIGTDVYTEWYPVSDTAGVSCTVGSGPEAVTDITTEVTAEGLEIQWTDQVLQEGVMVGDILSEYGYAYYKITEGSTYAGSTEVGRSLASPFLIAFPGPGSVLSAGSHRFWVVVVSNDGAESPATYYADKTIASPSAPTLSTEKSKDIVTLTWTDCETTFDINYYEVMHYITSEGEVTALTDKIPGLSTFYKLEWIGEKTFKVRAVDKAGNPGSYDTEAITISAVGAPTALTTTAAVYQVQISVTFPTNEYFAGCEIWASATNDRADAKKIAEVSGTTNPSTVVHNLAAAIGDEWFFWAKSKDIYGNYSSWYPSSDTAGVYGTPSTTPADYLAAVTGSINYTDFVESLQAGLGEEDSTGWKYFSGEGYSLYVNGNGNITGWRNFNDITAPTINNFDIWCDRFRIINNGNEGQDPVVPFVVGTVTRDGYEPVSMVGVNGDLVVDGTILVEKIAFAVIDEDYITDGQHHLSQIYDDGGTLTISSGSIVLATAGDLTINSGGGVQVNAAEGIVVNKGGDITLINEDNTNPAKIIWEDLTHTFSIFTSNNATYSYLYLQGDSSVGFTNLYARYFEEIVFYFNEILLFEDNSGNFDGSFGYDDGRWTISGDSSASFVLYVTTEAANLFKVTPSSVETNRDFLPMGDGTLDLGSSAYAFAIAYVQALTNPNGTLEIHRDAADNESIVEVQQGDSSQSPRFAVYGDGSLYLHKDINFRNKIFGGDFSTNPWQRGTTITSPVSDDYLADRWKFMKSGAAVFTVTKDADAPTAAENDGHYCTHCMKLDVTTADTSIAAGDAVMLRYAIEGNVAAPLGFGQAGTRYVTLSFWVKTTVTGKYCVAFSCAGSARKYIAEYTVTATNTWEKKTITVAVDVDAGDDGTYNYDASVGLYLYFVLVAGSSWQGTGGQWITDAGLFAFATSNQVNAASSTSNDFKIALVQLESGSVATAFEQRPESVEQNLCYRYYWRGIPTRYFNQFTTAVGQAASWGISFPVKMRATPAVDPVGETGSNYGSIAADNPTVQGCRLVAIATAANVSSHIDFGTDGYIEADAEYS